MCGPILASAELSYLSIVSCYRSLLSPCQCPFYLWIRCWYPVVRFGCSRYETRREKNEQGFCSQLFLSNDIDILFPCLLLDCCVAIQISTNCYSESPTNIKLPRTQYSKVHDNRSKEFAASMHHTGSQKNQPKLAQFCGPFKQTSSSLAMFTGTTSPQLAPTLQTPLIDSTNISTGPYKYHQYKYHHIGRYKYHQHRTLQISSFQDVDLRKGVLNQPVEALEKPLSDVLQLQSLAAGCCPPFWMKPKRNFLLIQARFGYT